MKYPYGYCGMPCALCTRNRTEGKSRCPGCSCDGYYTDVCKVHRCCREKGLAHCGACPDFPCSRLGKMGDFRDLNTGHAKQRACAQVAQSGLQAWYRDYAARAELLTAALAAYNDGRMKRFLCELFLRRELPALQELMRRAERIEGTPKEAGKAFRALAEELAESERPPIVLRPFERRDTALLARWLSAPHVARWYQEPQEWLREAENADGAYSWLHHFIAEADGEPVGFCQHYEYRLGGEGWHGKADTDGAYSIDYLIGDAARLGQGLGKRLVASLIEAVGQIGRAKRIIARPAAENLASCGLLRVCGFRFDEQNKIYVYDFDGSRKTLL